MNDFLHSLRTGKDKRYDRTRRGHDSSPYRPNDRHSGMDKRKRGNYGKSNVAENAYVTIAKLLPPVKSLLETIVSDRKGFMEIEERKAVAMETIARYLGKMNGVDSEEVEPVDMQQETTESQTRVTHPEKTNETDEDPVLTANETTDTTEAAPTPTDIIRDLREQGLSYDKIARHLDTENIPTPSGRGRWRGQAVSKLLKQATSASR